MKIVQIVALKTEPATNQDEDAKEGATESKKR